MPNLNDLHPDVATKAEQLLYLAAAEGIDLRITSGYRSPEKQAELYAQGRTAPGAIVTNAPPGKSYHNSGRAIDVVPYKNGKPDWESPQWTRLGELGKSLGFGWGGDFKSIKDRPHFELKGVPAAPAPSLLARVGSALSPRSASAAERRPDMEIQRLADTLFPAQAPGAPTATASPAPSPDIQAVADLLFPAAQAPPSPQTMGRGATPNPSFMGAPARTFFGMTVGAPFVGKPATRENLTAAGENALPMLGEAAGGALAGPPGAAIGAGAGVAAQQYLEGKPIDPWAVTKEVAWSFVPEAAEWLLKRGGPMLLRATRAGHTLRKDEAARLTAGAAEQIFQAPERQAVSALFEQVRQSGVKMDITPVRQFLQARPPAQLQDILTRDIRAIDTQMRNGKKYETLLRGTLGGPGGMQVSGMDIGEMQTLRSHLRQRAEMLQDPAAQDLLNDLKDVIDDAIETGLTVGTTPAGATPDLLAEARRQWARVRNAEDLGSLLTTTPVTRITGNGQLREFDFDRLLNILQDNRTRLARSINRGFDLTPGARDTMLTFLNDLRQIMPEGKLGISDTSGLRRFAPVASIDRMVSYLLLTPTGQEMFRQMIVRGNGRVSAPDLALLVNAVRREHYGSSSTETETAPRTSPQAPTTGIPQFPGLGMQGGLPRTTIDQP